MNIPNLTYKSNLLISAPKIDTDLLWDLSILFIGLAVVYLLSVFFYRNRISSITKKVRDRKRELSPMISEFLFLEEDASKDEKSNYIALKIEIRQLLKDSFNRKVLSEVLLDLRKDISGEAQQSLFRLFQDLGLHKDAFAKLKSWRWQVISKGILELTQMEVTESYGFITKFINDKRSTIRKQAEIATVTLRHEGINYFLDTTKYKISEWQQLKLLDVIRNKEDFQPPRFKAWLTSNNKYVVLFALRLIKYYHQNDANTSLIELVKHRNGQIKEEAIACIKEFNVIESLDTLKLVFWNCSITVKIAILDAIAQIGDEADIDFLNLIDKKELNFSVKSKALSSINSIAPERIMPSKGIQDESRYKIPNDITEAVAKMHAEKHEEISGEKDKEYIEEELIGELPSIEGNESHLTEEKVQAQEEVHADLEAMAKELVKDSTPLDEDETLIVNDDMKALYEIEVQIEEVSAIEGEETEMNFGETIWGEDHLNFLPLVVSKETDEHDSDRNLVSKTQDSMSPEKNIRSIQVIDEELVSNKSVEEREKDIPSEKTVSILREFDMEELAFLPIVVEDLSEPMDAQSKDSANERTELLDTIVHYDEVQPNSFSNENTSDFLTSDLEFDFEPNHELDDIDLNQHLHSNGSSYECYNTKEIRDTSVIYEEVFDTIEEGSKLEEINVVDPHVLSPEIISEQASSEFSVTEEETEEIELPTENEQLLKKIVDDLLTFDSTSREANDDIDDSYINPDWDLDENELDFTPVSFEKDESQTPSFIKIEKAENDFTDDEIAIPKASIPKAIFGDIEFEATTRQLLNDLEEMGDQREIPFLKELLTHEKYDVFKGRINMLIETFDHEEMKEKFDNPLQPFSVFQDLFRTCDTEAKLILLNEVVDVGDEKELRFLEDLTKDHSPEIRKKALTVLKELRLKLFGIEEPPAKYSESERDITESVDPSEAFTLMEPKFVEDPTDIFDLNFDLTEDLDKNEGEKKNDAHQDIMQYGPFFGQICSFSTKIMEKLNG